MSAATATRANEQRAAWLTRKPFCAIGLLAGEQIPASETHHIAGRNRKRPDLYEVTANWLRLSSDSHRAYHDGDISHRDIALAKLIADPEEFDGALLARLRPEKFWFCRVWLKD